MVATRTAGIAPECAKVLHLVDDEDAGQLAVGLTAVFGLDMAARTAQIEQNRRFLETRTWERQASRFLEFLQRCGIQNLD